MDSAIEAPAPQLTGELVRLLDGSLRIEDFVATMVHEAAQPLTAIQVLVTALRERGDDLDSDERDRLLADIDSQATFLRDLAGWMLEPFARQTVIFDELIGEIVERCRGCAPESTLVTELNAPGVVVDCETVRVEASIRNLVKNATTHSPATSPVLITTRFDGELAIIGVTDAGPGIPEQEWEQIFKPYTRVNDDGTPGSGLGLFVVNSCAVNHDGYARVATSGPAGTTIELALRAVA
ncbi:MAG: HAMP domain-containing histidine kinase [Actinobacteria bacterium]|nr:HAMP domain-containing histidine kinase [Actinomycetota bacterium]